MDNNALFEQIQELQSKSIEMQIYSWTHNEVFSLQWWLLMAIFIVPWLIWWKYVDRKRLLEILLYGFFVLTVVTFIDEVGCQLNLWEYPFDIEPLFPRLIPVNFTALPVVFMFIYQYFSKWKPFIIASVLVSAVLSFAGENILEWAGIYVLFKWENYYSLPIYVIIGTSLKWLLEIVLKKEKNARSQ
ncbi:MAG: hypothetical protein GX425_06305 [Peptococcaceae bacterium]|nr:hypothetical protein [Peptococcaceae bacterium]